MHGITITCAHCGASTDFDAATDGNEHDKAELREIMAEYLAECDEERG